MLTPELDARRERVEIATPHDESRACEDGRSPSCPRCNLDALTADADKARARVRAMQAAVDAASKDSESRTCSPRCPVCAALDALEAMNDAE